MEKEEIKVIDGKKYIVKKFNKPCDEPFTYLERYVEKKSKQKK